ncbi:NUDIX domain-containing protein [Candidatus Pelagibacter sp.]|nr:NUDIX domain-containing protein [Candidatus Pelagibacter sp.]
MKKSVGAIIFYNGKYLLQKRDNKKNIFFPNFWGVFGGSVDPKESKKKAVIRELKEEISLEMHLKKKIFSIYFNSEIFKKKRDRTYYLCTFKSKNFKIVLNEGQKYKFFKIEEIKKLNIVPWDLKALLYYDLFYIKKLKLIPR